MEANKETDGCRLKDLPGFLIGQVWPRERVVMGLKVSKWLREEIHANAEAVLFSAAKGLGHSPDAFETSDIRSDLNKFSSSTKVYVSVDNVTAFKVSKILDAIVKTFSPEPQSILPICSSPPPKPESTLGHCLAGLCMDRLGGGDGEILPFLTALQHCSAMEEVAIREFWIGDDGREYLAKAIASFRELKCLDLQLYLGDEGAEQLAQALVSCTALQQLTLQHNHIQDRGLEVLFGALGNCRRLHHVDLQHNMLGLSGAVAIGTLLAHCSHLQLLDLSHTKLDDELASALLLNLQLDAPRSLQHFRLRCNNFTSATVAELAAITWPALQTLDLEENQVGDEGATVLASALHRFSALRTLSLGRGGVGENGTVALSEALRRGDGRALTELNLGWNMLQLGGAEALAQALPCCPLLSTLKLSSNQITGEGLTAITAVLPQCQALVKLDLRSNAISQDAAAALAHAMAECEGVMHVDLRWNRFTDTRWLKALPDLSHSPYNPDGSESDPRQAHARSVLRLH